VGRVAAVAIGSNLGDRATHLAFARIRLEQLLSDCQFSTTRETDPVGVFGQQPPFLNAAAVGETDLTPRELLNALLAVEQERGRERPQLNAPRTLDLDLVLHGDSVLELPDLIVPHPRFRERLFVLQPLAEIAPALVDPVTRKTIEELLRALQGGTE
jgi:2-amino-4-hydroxy-6-hydroxymethyldihydropteridine diphosphokinase